ncbi:MAG TPA: hypothetical protein VI854_01345, partial [Acidimicrobiia bacterium]|nr:hypothetical protein [Acidimicrobiia bacterium]
MWQGVLRAAFVGWFKNVDGWMRNPLAEGLAGVAAWVDARIRAIEELSKQMAAGLAPAPLAPPEPLRRT